MERVHSGIEGLDEMIAGGYPKGRSILIIGTTGSAKHIGVSFIHKACQEGRKSLIIATEELPEDIIAQAESVGMSFEKFKTDASWLLKRSMKSEQRMPKKYWHMEWMTAINCNPILSAYWTGYQRILIVF